MGNRHSASSAVVSVVDFSALDDTKLETVWNKHAGKKECLGKKEVKNLVYAWCDENQIKPTKAHVQDFWIRVDANKVLFLSLICLDISFALFQAFQSFSPSPLCCLFCFCCL